MSLRPPENTLRHARSFPCRCAPHALASSIALALAGLFSSAAQAGEAAAPTMFNPHFITGGEGQAIDLSRYAYGNPVEPGRYRVDAHVNDRVAGRLDVQVQAHAGEVRYCLAEADLATLGIDMERLPESDPEAVAADDDCFDVVRRVPGARVAFDLSELRLDLGIPQAYMGRDPRGHTPPGQWEQGIAAAFLDYNANASDGRTGGRRQRQAYAGVHAGANLGGWRLRHNGSYTHDDAKGSLYHAISTYAQRDVTALASQLTIGESYTPAGVFDAAPFTGVQLASDERMLPDAQRGFAPVIRGVAETSARITVRQGGNVLHEITVAPGPFVIDDLYATGYAGDLDVTVTEADGRSRRFTVPFASIPQLLRPGSARYSVTAGRYRDDALADAPYFMQGTYRRGMSNHWTGYAGAIAAKGYLAAQGGVAFSTHVGALAFDVTHSQAGGLAVAGGDASATGESYRLSYSKLVEATGTNLVVAAYRFSSEGYLDLAGFARSITANGDPPARQRSRLQLNVSQPMGRFGNLHLSGSMQAYWNAGEGNDATFQASYGKRFGWGGLNLSASRTRAADGRADNQYALNVSLPLGRAPRSPYLNTSLSHSGAGRRSAQASLSGTLGEQDRLSYTVHGAYHHDDASQTRSAGANAQYRGTHATVSASHADGDGYRQTTLGMSGSVVAHPGGINMTGAQGETRAVIAAAGAQGATVLNGGGQKIAGNGYAVISGLTPYRYNEVALDPKGMSRDVELAVASQRVVPRHGAIVWLEYPTVTGYPVLLRLHDEAGRPLPVGAEVLDADGRSLTLVGQGSRVFLRVQADESVVHVRWGAGPHQHCRARFRLDKGPGTDFAFAGAEAVCARDASSTPVLSNRDAGPSHEI